MLLSGKLPSALLYCTCTPVVCIIPGHGLTSHGIVSTSPATLMQLWPPWAAGVVTLNVLVIVPGPHDGEHSVKLDHEPKQSTESDECYCQEPTSALLYCTCTPAVCSIPGHGLTSHVEVSTSPVTLGQLFPPSTAGVVTVYVLVVVPGPHVAEHSV
jgi:hypothetical protein